MGANDYTLGRGRVLFKKENTNGYRDLGNAPDFKTNIEVEKLAHFNSQSGLRVKDQEIVVQQLVNCAFTLDEPVIENLALFLSADTPTETTVAGGSVAGESQDGYHDRLTQLDNYNITEGTVVVTSDPVGTTYVEGTDYEVLYSQGWIKILESGTIGDGDPLLISYDHTGVTTKQANAATKTTIRGDIRFLGDPAAGRIIDVRGFVSLSAEGDISLISEEWLAFNFAAEFLDSTDYTGLAEFIDRGQVTV